MDHDLHKCNEDDCMICLDGLSSCNSCGGAEASMPTDCPGVRMTVDQIDAVQAGTLDFVAGSWIKK